MKLLVASGIQYTMQNSHCTDRRTQDSNSVPNSLLLLYPFLPSAMKLRRSCFYTCLSVILFTGGGGGGCLSACWDAPRSRPPRTRHPPGAGTPRADTPPSRHTHPEQTHTPGNRHPPSRRLMLRTVRILLECILIGMDISTQIGIRVCVRQCK